MSGAPAGGPLGLDPPRATVAVPGMVQLSALPPLSLYVHLPWCLRKCPYCDFNSHERPAKPVSGPSRSSTGAGGGRSTGLPQALESAYVQALIADLEVALPQVWGRRVETVFIGGGTPSLFSPEAIDRLLSAVRARLPLRPDAEITLEANPGSFERDRFRAYRQAGVTRLSLGVQSFDDTLLDRLGRVHDAAQARAAAREAAEVFERFNLDLMYALPGQTLEALEADLDQALSFAPPHLSIYHLTLEPNTVFASRPPPHLPDEDLAAEMLDRIVARTQAVGLARYEVSAFARTGQPCAHNLNYWQFGDYLGIGAGAHGKISFPQRVLRQVRWREPERYMRQALEGQAASQEHPVARRDLPFEFMLNALRLVDGVPAELFSLRTGLPPSAIAATLTRAQARGLLEVQGQGALARIRPTARGLDFLSDLLAMFLPESG